MRWRSSAVAAFVRWRSIVGPGVLVAAVVLATMPAGANDAAPEMSPNATRVRNDPKAFGSDPKYSGNSYDPKQQIQIYGGKKNIEEPRPMLELGQKLYVEGPLDPYYNVIGRKNLVQPAFSIFGDWRSAVAYNNNGHGKQVGQIATRLNLETDYQFTATERIHALFRPLDQGGEFTHADFFGPDQKGAKLKLNGQVRTLFFEGDLGSIVSGFSDRWQSFDAPFAVGLVPLLFQNGIWANSALVGGAFTIPARNSPKLGIANMDLTFFAGFDDVTTPAIKDAKGNLVNHGLSVYGAAAFIEANEGYWEAGLGYLDDRRGLANDASYGSATLAFTRRYFGWLSNSVRGIWTFGQEPQANKKRTADGFIVLIENSLVSKQPLVLVPYLNFFAGFGHPQSLIRNADAGGVLFNTGILFQTDGLTGYPKLDDTGQNAYGGALGLEYLFDLDRQIVLEAATVQVNNFDPVRPAKDSQYGVGARYQQNLTKALLFRADVMYAWRLHDENVAGVRTELRLKF